MHGYRRGKPSEYGIRLREKQKLKRFYGVFERQFRRYFELASRSPENTGEVLLSIMERRLDNVVHRLGFAPNRAAARQLVTPRPRQRQRPGLQHPEPAAEGRRHRHGQEPAAQPAAGQAQPAGQSAAGRPTTWSASAASRPKAA